MYYRHLHNNVVVSSIPRALIFFWSHTSLIDRNECYSLLLRHEYKNSLIRVAVPASPESYCFRGFEVRSQRKHSSVPFGLELNWFYLQDCLNPIGWEDESHCHHTGPFELKSGKKYKKLSFSKCNFQCIIRFLTLWKVGNHHLLGKKCLIWCSFKVSNFDNFLILAKMGNFY